MLSQDEIQDWANRAGRDLGFRLVEFEQKEASGVRRAKTHIRFDAYDREYHIWALPELDLLLLDVYYTHPGIDEQLFKGEISAQSLEAIETKWSRRARSTSANVKNARGGARTVLAPHFFAKFVPNANIPRLGPLELRRTCD